LVQAEICVIEIKSRISISPWNILLFRPDICNELLTICKLSNVYDLGISNLGILGGWSVIAWLGVNAKNEVTCSGPGKGRRNWVGQFIQTVGPHDALPIIQVDSIVSSIIWVSWSSNNNFDIFTGADIKNWGGSVWTGDIDYIYSSILIFNINWGSLNWFSSLSINNINWKNEGSLIIQIVGIINLLVSADVASSIISEACGWNKDKNVVSFADLYGRSGSCYICGVC